MAAKLFVGNLSWNATEEEIKDLFSSIGEVLSVRIVADPYTGRSKGFGFVEMKGDKECDDAIEKLDNYEVQGRPLRVSRARQENAGGPRPQRGPGGDRRSSGPRGPGGPGAYSGQRDGQRGGGQQRQYQGGNSRYDDDEG